MTCKVAHISVACDDACTLSTWWKQVLDHTDLPDDPNENHSPTPESWLPRGGVNTIKAAGREYSADAEATFTLRAVAACR